MGDGRYGSRILLCITREFPEPGSYAQVGVGFTPEVYAQLERAAVQKRVSKGELIREAVAWFLEREIQKPPPRKRSRVKSIRRTADLPEEHVRMLNEIAGKMGISRSYLIERAAIRYLQVNNCSQ
ncbi:MAG: ribbon-helix-helix protein, CopG family [Bacillota bacterium]